MGVVWEASAIATGERVAIKVLREREYNAELEKRFLREAEAANAVKHPGIVRVHEVLHDPSGMPAFVMDLLEGEPLVTRLERETKLTLGQTAAILLPVISAVRAAHRAGVVHRDLKPDNVYLTREPNGSTSVRVLDFGIARLVQPNEKLTVTGTLMGTPLYMSPEQAAGEVVDPRTDHWSLAALAFECLTGLTVVQGVNYGQILSNLIRRDITTLASLGTGLPPDLVAAVDCLLVERERRPDLGALEAALARHADRTIAAPPANVPISARVPGDAETMFELTTPSTRPPSSRRVVAVAAVLGAMLVVGIGLAGISLVARARPAATNATAAPAFDAAPPLELHPATTTTSGEVAPSAEPKPVASANAQPTPEPRPAESHRPAASATPARPVRIQGGVAGGVAPF